MKNWNDITIEKFEEIRNILEVEDEYTVLNLIDCVYGIDSGDLKVTEMPKYDIRFISQPIPECEVPKKMTLNGREYDVDCNLTKITAAQYVDFTNMTSKNGYKYNEVLSVFVFPAGHKYNDGYDMNQVFEDLKQLKITDAISMSKFFFLQFKLFAEIFRLYLTQSITGMQMEGEKEEMRKKLLERLEEVDLVPLELFHT